MSAPGRTGPAVIIVGSGIVGAAFACRLAQAGARVTVIEAAPVTGGLATPASWAWINASLFNPEPYARFRHRAMLEWHCLTRDVPGLEPAWSGSLLWDAEPATLAQRVAAHAAWGYPVRLVGAAEFAALEPAVALPPDLAALASDEGSVDPVAATRALLAAAVAAGASVSTNQAVTGLRHTGTVVTGVRTATGDHCADEVILCAGTATSGLLADLGLQLAMREAPGLVLHSAPLPPLLRHMLITPRIELRQARDGRLVVVGDLDPLTRGPLQTAQSLLAEAASLLTGRPDLRLAAHQVAFRPMPQDGLPVAGRVAGVTGLYLAVCHSGVTLAPLLANLGACALLTGATDPDLGPYAPDRLVSAL